MLDISGLQVIYEDNHLIAVNKPVGWLVHGDATGDTPLSEYVKAYLKIRYKKPGEVFLGVLHRLDRPVSGVVIFTRTSKALTRMNKLMQERAIQKTYYAVTAERPQPINGELVHYLLKDPQKNSVKAYAQTGRRTAKAKKATLQYELAGEMDGHYLLRVKPLTGRPHQIRVQLSEMGCPIVADWKYGHRETHPDGGIYLHCHQMSFVHPVKKEPIAISVDFPAHQYWNWFRGIISSP
ncbi:MAG: RluA family pseudouridine synthase [Bacteroidota bacterium]